ncbi:hypothetical protein OHA40_32200 [Nocardia sp. NBC_00508]|uniref:hypothetical protein n=1 Tax=Nocardia sp. NBC_00508 TaxID=2975992 RepID=UPI002E81A28D|nr:hypothetical protein [Nocardia sp. NBC_00508]WUD66168.1 hypothetical protein OHA40_32200 [Nocardia sp. NBC_00508]
MLYQNDDFGKDLLDSFRAAVAGSGVRIVAGQSYEVTDPTVEPQVRNLAGSKADVLLNFSGITVPDVPAGVRPSWYGLTLRYRADELGGLPIRRFYDALHAEGCREVDRPGSTCPLNLLPLFQQPGLLHG